MWAARPGKWGQWGGTDGPGGIDDIDGGEYHSVPRSAQRACLLVMGSLTPSKCSGPFA